MKPLTNTQLNRIKIKDLMYAIKQDIDINVGLGLCRIENYDRIEKYALRDATDNDLQRIEQIFIKQKLGIDYFPSQNKKRTIVNGEQKIVPIDYDYGSDNS